jgi:hypothetical protein
VQLVATEAVIIYCWSRLGCLWGRGDDSGRVGAMNRKGWRRGVLVTAGLAAGVTVVAARDTSPIGHFTSAAAQDRFLAAYDKAMRMMPPPDQTLDLRTPFGVVRVYRFNSGASARRVPIMLLPGRASASPIWADNLPTLLRQAPIYTVDLLGEPGMSIQSRPITSAADQPSGSIRSSRSCPNHNSTCWESPSAVGLPLTLLFTTQPRSVRSSFLTQCSCSDPSRQPRSFVRSRLASLGYRRAGGTTSTAGPPTAHLLRTCLRRR